MRKFFVVTYDDRDDMETVSDYELGDFDDLVFWRGKPFRGKIPASVKLLVESGVPRDYLSNPLSWPILSDRFVQVADKIAGHDIQCFPAPLYNEKTLKPISGYQIVNVTRIIDALAKPLITVDKMVLKAALIPLDVHLFRLVGEESLLMASEEFHESLRGHHVKGIALIKTKSGSSPLNRPFHLRRKKRGHSSLLNGWRIAW